MVVGSETELEKRNKNWKKKVKKREEEKNKQEEKKKDEKKSEAVYTATPVAGGWAGAVMCWAGVVMIWAGASISLKY